MAERDVILWDGECGFCRQSVLWVKRHDEGDHFDAVPYQKVPSPPMTPELREACARSVHVITPAGDVLRGGQATLHILERIGFPRSARLLGHAPLSWLVEAGYQVVSRNRKVLSRLMFRRQRRRELARAHG